MSILIFNILTDICQILINIIKMLVSIFHLPYMLHNNLISIQQMSIYILYISIDIRQILIKIIIIFANIK